MTKIGQDNIKLQTHTTIEFSDKFKKDSAFLGKNKLEGIRLKRILNVINPLRSLKETNLKFRMVSKNDFPTQAGLASSASAFAALALAANDALSLRLSKEEISTFARLGSGSASRSIHGGFVQWYSGKSHKTSKAEQIIKPNKFPMNAVIAVINEREKDITSHEGHSLALKSPFDEKRVEETKRDVVKIKKALKTNDFSTVGKLSEKSCLMMHSVMMTSGLFYWNSDTFKIIELVRDLRLKGTECYYTIDAGPNVHIICKPKDTKKIERVLKKQKHVKKTIIAKQADDSQIVKKHLF